MLPGKGLLAWTGENLTVTPHINRRLVGLQQPRLRMRKAMLTDEEPSALGQLLGHRSRDSSCRRERVDMPGGCW